MNPVGAELEILYHWQNPKVINRFGILNGMHSRTSIQPAMKYRQAQALSIKLPMKARLMFGLPTKACHIRTGKQSGKRHTAPSSRYLCSGIPDEKACC